MEQAVLIEARAERQIHQPALARLLDIRERGGRLGAQAAPHDAAARG